MGSLPETYHELYCLEGGGEGGGWGGKARFLPRVCKT